MQGHDEFLDLRPAHRARAPLCTVVDDVQPEGVFIEDPIDALAPGVPDGFARVLSRAAVLHANQHIHHERLKERRSRLHDLVEKLPGETFPQGLEGVLQGFLRLDGRVRRLLAGRRRLPLRLPQKLEAGSRERDGRAP